MRRLRRLAVRGVLGAVSGAALELVLSAGLTLSATPAAGATTTTSPVNGQGSTYAALAFQTWTQGAQINDGLNVNYTATGSPAGLSAYASNTATFAGTEAEYSELYPGTPNPTQHVPRGFAYTPDVAGAVAVMYHVKTPAGTTVNYLHLTPLTIARIFMGYIKTWASPTISADNKGLVLAKAPITLCIRAGQSGTTALFYDWVKHTDPSQFYPWAQANHFPTSSRVWEVDNGTAFGSGPGFYALQGSDQQAQHIASATGLDSIGYDEFGYAFVYHDNVAWVENASGNWTQPYAKNIAAALKSAVLAPDTSQTLVGVYNSATPNSYPMSAYSYILYQCAPTGTRPTCKQAYSNQGVIDTMAKFLRYVACTGQVRMAQIGYSPLPADLSQFLANAIGYMTGKPAQTLSAGTCTNPQFRGGDLGVGATPPLDPYKGVTSLGPGAGGGGPTSSSSGGSSTHSSGGSGGGTTATGGSTGSGGTTPGGTSTGATTATSLRGAVLPGVVRAVGGGSGVLAAAQPTVWDGPAPPGAPAPWPWLLLLLLLAVPVACLSLRSRAGPAADRPADAVADCPAPPQ